MIRKAKLQKKMEDMLMISGTAHMFGKGDKLKKEGVFFDI